MNTASSAFRTRIKLCGMMREQDIDAAIKAGADALGFVLWPGSKRAVDESRLVMLCARVPAFVTRVGLFVDQDPELIRRASPHLDLLQFHGEESVSFCASFERPYIKALRMREGLDLHAAADTYSGARALLLDAYKPGVPGGTGETFDWERIPATLAKPVILAGGLNAANVAQAIRQVRPFAVDVSGGIENGPGIKDTDKIDDFVRQVTLADAY